MLLDFENHVMCEKETLSSKVFKDYSVATQGARKT
jgi:hypothetical protein